MEIFLSSCVGVLSATSLNLLLGAVSAKEAGDWKRAVQEVGTRKRLIVQNGLLRLEGIALEHGIISPRLRVRQVRVEKLLPEAFGTLAISLGSGLSLVQAIRYVGFHAEEPVRSEFLRAASEMSCGISASEALDALVDRMRAPGLDLVTLALSVSRRTGAPLAELLAEASRLAEDRVELARRLDVKTSQARMSARLVACMPIGMILFLSLLSSDFRIGVATPTGLASIAIALTLNVTAGAIIHHIMQVRL